VTIFLYVPAGCDFSWRFAARRFRIALVRSGLPHRLRAIRPRFSQRAGGGLRPPALAIVLSVIFIVMAQEHAAVPPTKSPKRRSVARRRKLREVSSSLVV